MKGSCRRVWAFIKDGGWILAAVYALCVLAFLADVLRWGYTA